MLERYLLAVFQEVFSSFLYELVVKVMKLLLLFFFSFIAEFEDRKRDDDDHVATTLPTSRSEKPSVQAHLGSHL